jgi:hypothetical protein
MIEVFYNEERVLDRLVYRQIISYPFLNENQSFSRGIVSIYTIFDLGSKKIRALSVFLFKELKFLVASVRGIEKVRSH